MGSKNPFDTLLDWYSSTSDAFSGYQKGAAAADAAARFGEAGNTEDAFRAAQQGVKAVRKAGDSGLLEAVLALVLPSDQAPYYQRAAQERIAQGNVPAFLQDLENTTEGEDEGKKVSVFFGLDAAAERARLEPETAGLVKQYLEVISTRYEGISRGYGTSGASDDIPNADALIFGNIPPDQAVVEAIRDAIQGQVFTETFDPAELNETSLIIQDGNIPVEEKVRKINEFYNSILGESVGGGKFISAIEKYSAALDSYSAQASEALTATELLNQLEITQARQTAASAAALAGTPITREILDVLAEVPIGQVEIDRNFLSLFHKLGTIGNLIPAEEYISIFQSYSQAISDNNPAAATKIIQDYLSTASLGADAAPGEFKLAGQFASSLDAAANSQIAPLLGSISEGLRTISSAFDVIGLGLNVSEAVSMTSARSDYGSLVLASRITIDEIAGKIKVLYNDYKFDEMYQMMDVFSLVKGGMVDGLSLTNFERNASEGKPLEILLGIIGGGSSIALSVGEGAGTPVAPALGVAAVGTATAGVGLLYKSISALSDLSLDDIVTSLINLPKLAGKAQATQGFDTKFGVTLGATKSTLENSSLSLLEVYLDISSTFGEDIADMMVRRALSEYATLRSVAIIDPNDAEWVKTEFGSYYSFYSDPFQPSVVVGIENASFADSFAAFNQHQNSKESNIYASTANVPIFISSESTIQYEYLYKQVSVVFFGMPVPGTSYEDLRTQYDGLRDKFIADRAPGSEFITPERGTKIVIQDVRRPDGTQAGLQGIKPGTYVYDASQDRWCRQREIGEVIGSASRATAAAFANLPESATPLDIIRSVGENAREYNQANEQYNEQCIPGYVIGLAGLERQVSDLGGNDFQQLITQGNQPDTPLTQIPVVIPTGGDEETAPTAAGLDTIILNLDSDVCKLSRLYEPLEKHFISLSVEGTAGTKASGDLFLSSKYLKVALTDETFVPNYKDNINQFYNDPNIFSNKVPSYRIYKVYRQPSDGKASIGNIERIQEIKFPKTRFDRSVGEKSLDVKYQNAKNETDKFNVLNTYAKELKVDNIGVKSIDWHYEGTDRFTADKVISSEIVLFMENFDALFKDRTGEDGRTYKISDLLIHPNCIKSAKERPVSPSQQTITDPYDSQERIVYDPGCYEVLIEAGYLDMEGMYSSLYLSLTDHEFSFQENGSVEVRIRYRGRIEANLRSASSDIIIDNNGIVSDQVGALLQKLQTTAAKDKILDSDVVERQRFVPAGTGQSASIVPTDVELETAGENTIEYKAKKESYSALTKKLEAQIRQLSSKSSRDSSEQSDLDLMKGVLAQIDKDIVLQFFGRISKVLIDYNRIFHLRVKDSANLKDYLTKPSPISLKNLINELNGKINSKNDERLIYNSIALADAYDVAAQAAAKPADPTSPAQPAPGVSFPDPNDAQAKIQEEQESKASENGGANTEDPAAVPETIAEKTIPYVYFGHLVDALIYVCRGVDANSPNNLLDNLMVVLPSIMMPSVDSNFAALKPISMAAIPVAVSTFMNFANSRAEMGQKSYTFLSLFRDMINEVLVESLGVQCPEKMYMPVYKPNLYQFTRYNTTLDNYLTYNAQQTPIRPAGSYKGNDILNNLPIEKFINTELQKTASKNIVYKQTEIKSVTALVPYIELSDYSQVATGRKNDDLKRGIPHFTFGSNDNGLFIKCNLQKVDQPYLIESRFTNTNGYILTQFSNIYNASLEMIGNDLLELGNYVYLNFKTMAGSLGDPNKRGSLSYFMGLGGVHLITDIKTTMQPGEYKTTIQARYVGRGGMNQPQS